MIDDLIIEDQSPLIKDSVELSPQRLECFLLLDSLWTYDFFIILLLLNNESSFSCTLASMLMLQHCSLEVV